MYYIVYYNKQDIQVNYEEVKMLQKYSVLKFPKLQYILLFEYICT